MNMRRASWLLAAVILLVGAAEENYRQAIVPWDWSFPRDHGRHDGFRTEWWYFTGNLVDSSGREFGYQITFFRTAVTPNPTTRPSRWGLSDLYFAHAAISNVPDQKFVFKDRFERGRPGLAWASDQTLDVLLLDWSARLEADGIHLHAAEKGFAIDLVCRDGRGPILEGPGGVTSKGNARGQASYYYSMTRLDTAGSLSVDGSEYSVKGQSWMDHEFSSNSLAKNQTGWDWMGLQLSDGNDLMIYRMRDKSGGTDYLSGTRIDTNGQPHYLSSGDIELAGSNPWKSPTGGDYPQTWSLRVSGMPPMIVQSAFPGQELVTNASTKVTYFEGAASVRNEQGKEIGKGYLEMTGYAGSINGP